ncbi:MAG: MltA domain-containing protein [Gemmatimonadaceae bacterium]|nr:MltA domain-containing protein [Gloeobacterales cyanobacterium ES-bin-141]
MSSISRVLRLALLSWLLFIPTVFAQALVPIDDPGRGVDLAAGFRDRWTLIRATDWSLKYLKTNSAKRAYPRLGISHARVVRSLERFRRLLVDSADDVQFAKRLREEFVLYQVNFQPEMPRDSVLMTGYFQPVYRASLTKSATFRYPLYRKPADLVVDGTGRALGRRTAAGVRPYPTRAEIEDTNLLNGLELVWLDDALARFLVHVQGAARLQLTDSRLFDIGFAAKTDRPYRSIGQALVRDGKIRAEDLTLQAIKDYFAQFPEQLEPYLRLNESYVFFRPTDEGGPYGSLGVPVTGMHSIATDKGIFPPGALAFIQAELKNGPLRQFALDQDAGAAIRGNGRVDLFVGTGPGAERIAGDINTRAQVYYLLLKE